MHAYNCHVVHACVNLHFACSTLRRCEHLFLNFKKTWKSSFCTNWANGCDKKERCARGLVRQNVPPQPTLEDPCTHRGHISMAGSPRRHNLHQEDRENSAYPCFGQPQNMSILVQKTWVPCLFKLEVTRTNSRRILAYHCLKLFKKTCWSAFESLNTWCLGFKSSTAMVRHGKSAQSGQLYAILFLNGLNFKRFYLYPRNCPIWRELYKRSKCHELTFFQICFHPTFPSDPIAKLHSVCQKWPLATSRASDLSKRG